MEGNYISVAEARNNLSDAVNRVCYGNERIGLMRRGRLVAVMVPIEDLKRLLDEEGKGV